MSRYCNIQATDLQGILETCNRHIKNILLTQYDAMEEEDEELLARDLFYCNMFRDTWNDLREDVLSIMNNKPKIIDSFRGEYDFLSNFYPCKINYNGNYYPTVEHAYQASKSLDESIRLEISKLETPGQAKRRGQKIEVSSNWNRIKIGIMRKMLEQKFSLGSDLHKKLKETGSSILIEGNNWGDTFWGMCNGEGKNYLGKILMAIRDNPLDEFN